MQGVTRGSRWQQPTLTSQPRGEHFQSLWSPTSCPGQGTFRLLTFRLFLLQNPVPAVRGTEQGWHHPHLHTPFPWNNLLLPQRFCPCPSARSVSLRVGSHRAYPEGFWGGLLALAVCHRSRVEGWSWRRSRLLLLIRGLAGSSGFCGLRHRGGGLKSVTGHQQQVRGRHGCGHPTPIPGMVTSGWGFSVGWMGRARRGGAGRFSSRHRQGSCLNQGDHRRSWSPHSPVVRRHLSMVPALGVPRDGA